MRIQGTKQSRLRLMLREKQAFQNANMSVANTLADATDFMNKGMTMHYRQMVCMLMLSCLFSQIELPGEVSWDGVQRKHLCAGGSRHKWRKARLSLTRKAL